MEKGGRGAAKKREGHSVVVNLYLGMANCRVIVFTFCTTW